jgi:hypothetical protein
MRLPRMTTRRWMIVVVVVAIVFTPVAWAPPHSRRLLLEGVFLLAWVVVFSATLMYAGNAPPGSRSRAVRRGQDCNG